jgi:hypothetical protein
VTQSTWLAAVDPIWKLKWLAHPNHLKRSLQPLRAVTVEKMSFEKRKVVERIEKLGILTAQLFELVIKSQRVFLR